MLMTSPIMNNPPPVIAVTSIIISAQGEPGAHSQEQSCSRVQQQKIQDGMVRGQTKVSPRNLTYIHHQHGTSSLSTGASLDNFASGKLLRSMALVEGLFPAYGTWGAREYWTGCAVCMDQRLLNWEHV